MDPGAGAAEGGGRGSWGAAPVVGSGDDAPRKKKTQT